MTTKTIELENQIVEMKAMIEELNQKLAAKTPKVKEGYRDYSPNDTNIKLIEQYGNKSQAIRALHKEGKTTSQIADLLNIRYQHVRNVLNQITKK